MMEPFKRAVEEAGLEAVTKTMRQAVTAQLVQADVNFSTVQRVSDHKNLAMFAKLVPSEWRAYQKSARQARKAI
jgi:hypothetical protein